MDGYLCMVPLVVGVGDTVSEDEVVGEIETDKVKEAYRTPLKNSEEFYIISSIPMTFDAYVFAIPHNWKTLEEILVLFLNICPVIHTPY